MNFRYLSLYLLLSFIAVNVLAQDTLTSGQLSIILQNTGHGVQLLGIQDNGTELLNTVASSRLFTLTITNTSNSQTETIDAVSGWDSVNLVNNDTACTLVLTHPESVNLSDSLKATVTIITNDEKSRWDIDVSGLGNGTLTECEFSRLNIKADGNDYFFVPYYWGKLFGNPASGMDYYDDDNDPNDNKTGLYPRGWGATMQYMAYYSNSYGLYFGYYDPRAALKKPDARSDVGSFSTGSV